MKKMIGADPLGILGEAESAGSIRLRIAINQQRVHFSGRKRSGKIDGSRGLAHAALLIGNSDDTSHEIFGGPERPAE